MAYIPGHYDRKRGHDSTTRGYPRWERAARNAIKHPLSQAADLYVSRYTVAREIAQAAAITGRTDVPYAFMVVDWTKQPRGESFKRSHVTCSVFCTIMQITLDYHTVDKVRIANIIKVGSEGRRGVCTLDRRTLRRAVRCHVCEKTVKPA